MAKGLKYDNEKPRWDLLPLFVVEEIVKVLTFGARKYSDHGWKTVKKAKERYFSACQRHLTAWQDGETIDKESNCYHLAHALCCLIIVLWHEMRGENERRKDNTHKN